MDQNGYFSSGWHRSTAYPPTLVTALRFLGRLWAKFTTAFKSETPSSFNSSCGAPIVCGLACTQRYALRLFGFSFVVTVHKNQHSLGGAKAQKSRGVDSYDKAII